ncbi:hypothetical protein BKA81DRAFT_377664 [Phyllosticta paracitricarpa]|uniref:Transmembrane protein n=2 Tax=Phyllosticta TaxID=121621 RepID=A0ABR1MDF6_9PEZI
MKQKTSKTVVLRRIAPETPVAKSKPPFTLYNLIDTPWLERVLDSPPTAAMEQINIEEPTGIVWRSALPDATPAPPVVKRLTIDPPPGLMGAFAVPQHPGVTKNGTAFRDTPGHKQFQADVRSLVQLFVLVLSFVIGYIVLMVIRKLTDHETPRERAQRLRNRWLKMIWMVETTFHLLSIPFRLIFFLIRRIWFPISIILWLIRLVFGSIPHFLIFVIFLPLNLALLIGWTVVQIVRLVRRGWLVAFPPGDCTDCRILTELWVTIIAHEATKLLLFTHALFDLPLPSSSGSFAWVLVIWQNHTLLRACVNTLVLILFQRRLSRIIRSSHQSALQHFDPRRHDGAQLIPVERLLDAWRRRAQGLDIDHELERFFDDRGW